jgi:hypothetical protein
LAQNIDGEQVDAPSQPCQVDVGHLGEDVVTTPFLAGVDVREVRDREIPLRLGQRSSEPSGEFGGSATIPWAASRSMVSCNASTWMTKWFNPPGSTRPPVGSWTSSRLTNSSPGSLSIVRLPNAVSGTSPSFW